MLGEWYQKTNKTEDTNKLTLFVSSVMCVFWYHSPNVLDTLHICNISWLRVKERREYSHLKEEALDRAMWRAGFGRGFGPVVRQTAE
jgi:hypothetical protein